MQFNLDTATFRSSNTPESSSSCWNLVTVILVISIVMMLIYMFAYMPRTYDASASGGTCGMKVKTESGPEHVESEDHFEKLLQNHPVVIVMFFADWCGHCQQLKPHFHNASEKASAKFLLVKDSQRALMSKHKIQGFPTVKRFDNGKFSSNYAGARNTEGLVAFAQ